MNTKEIREAFTKRKSWSESVYESLERFVHSKPDENIERFVKTEDLDNLYDGATLPNPRPTESHQEYILAVAEHYLNNK